MKKVFSVLLACVMAFSMLSVLAFAAPKDAVLEISIEPTQQSYSKGDVVKFEVFYTSSSDLGLMGCPFSFSVGFDSNVFETIENVQDKGNYEQHTETVIVKGYPVENNIVPSLSWSYVYSGAEERLTENDKAKGWNATFFTSMTPTNDCDDDYSVKKASFAFQLRIKEDAPDDGCYTLGITDYSIQNMQTEINEEVGAVAGPSGIDYGFECTNIFETYDATVNVATAAQSILQYSKAQIRFQGIGADKDKTNYKNAFDVRTVAKISQDDFVATFTDEANAKAKITDFGFVYAAKSNVADFSVDTAKAVAEGGSAENYVKKSVTYMQHTGDGADYVFTCLITDIADTDANKADGVNCLAFVCFDGTYYYFDAAASVSYGDLYTTHFPA